MGGGDGGEGGMLANEPPSTIAEEPAGLRFGGWEIIKLFVRKGRMRIRLALSHDSQTPHSHDASSLLIVWIRNLYSMYLLPSPPPATPTIGSTDERRIDRGDLKMLYNGKCSLLVEGMGK